MQLLKSFLAISAIATLASLPVVHAADSPEEAELRRLLRSQIGKPPEQAPATVAPAPAARPAAPSQPANSAPMKPAQPAYTPPQTSSSDVGSLRDALHREMAQPMKTPEPTSPPVVSQPAAQPQPQLTAQPPANEPAPAVSHAMTSTQPTNEILQTPPPAVSQSKEEKLNNLLRLYKADVITPEQYHKQRAEILAEP